MKFETLSAFIQMDGHGSFVWAAYGITLVVLVVNVVIPWMAQRRFVAGQRAAEVGKGDNR